MVLPNPFSVPYWHVFLANLHQVQGVLGLEGLKRSQMKVKEEQNFIKTLLHPTNQSYYVY